MVTRLKKYSHSVTADFVADFWLTTGGKLLLSGWLEIQREGVHAMEALVAFATSGHDFIKYTMTL